MVNAAVFKTEVLSGASAGSNPVAGTTSIPSKGESEMKASDQMKYIEAELARIRAEKDRLSAQEEVLLKLLGGIRNDGNPVKPTRTRSVPIKPIVLDIMAEVGFTGATTAEVDGAVRKRVPTVAKDSVGSILSRLKSAGALVHDGERYYEKQYAPRPNQTPELRVI